MQIVEAYDFNVANVAEIDELSTLQLEQQLQISKRRDLEDRKIEGRWLTHRHSKSCQLVRPRSRLAISTESAENHVLSERAWNRW